MRSVDLNLRQEPGVSAVARSGMSTKRVGGAVLGLVLESLEPRCVSPAALTRTRPLRQLSGNRKARTLIRVLAVPGRALPAVTPQRAVFQSRPYELMRQTGGSGITGPRAGDECSAAAPPDAQNIRAAQLSLGPIAVR